MPAKTNKEVITDIVNRKQDDLSRRHDELAQILDMIDTLTEELTALGVAATKV